MDILKAVKYCKYSLSAFSNRKAMMNRWHVVNLRPNQCVVGCLEMVHIFLTGRKLASEVVVQYIEAETGHGAEEGATFEEAITALRKMGVGFRAININTLGKTNQTNWRLSKPNRWKSTSRLNGKLLLVSDEQTYTEPHAVLLYRKGATIWLFDCLKLTGAYSITEAHALRLINASDETFLVSRK